MSTLKLSQSVQGIPALKALFLTIMPDCLLFDSWMREGSQWAAEDVASYFGDLVRANREGLKSLRSWSSDMQVTIESADALVVLKELRRDFVVSLVFDRESPLGMVRLYTRQLIERLASQLPQVEVQTRSLAVRALEFVERYAPDPHATIMRVALRSGITIEELQRPEQLSEEQAIAIETAAKDILGLDQVAY